MKKLLKTFLLVFLGLNSCLALPTDSLQVQKLLISFEEGLSFILEAHEEKQIELHTRLGELNQKLSRYENNENISKLVFLLKEKMELQEALAENEQAKGLQLAELRFKKGLDLIKLLHEKILGLDHHFSSLQTFHNVFQLTNPNSFPDFRRNQEYISKKLKKKNAIKLPQVAQTNSYLSAAFTLVSVFFNDDSGKQKEADLENISCVLDFTLRMHNELNTIYYETEFLKNGNETLKSQISTLFEEYIKVIGYNNSLEKCRSSDDWEVVYESLESFVRDLEEKKKKNDPIYDQIVFKGHVDLEFAVDRFLTFLEKYNDFITQGGKYYEKFQVIINNYGNEEFCVNKLPHQFSSLKKDIDLSISKFNEAYNIAELRGSKLKDLLYGLTD